MQLTSLEPVISDQNELMAGAIHHLRNVMETGSRRSCAVACMLFSCLSQDESLGKSLCEECKELSECLEGRPELSVRGNSPYEQANK